MPTKYEDRTSPLTPIMTERLTEDLAYCVGLTATLNRLLSDLQTACGSRVDENLTRDSDVFGREASPFDDRLYDQVWAAIAKLCDAYYELCQQLSACISTQAEGKIIGDEALNLHVSLAGDSIIVYVPVLPFSVNNKRKISSFRLFYDQIQGRISSVIASMDENLKRKFTHKVVSYFFVYPSNSANCPDADNYDTKGLTDAIVKLLPGGDSAESCKFSLQTVYSDRYKQGVYVVVWPQDLADWNMLFDQFEPKFRDVFAEISTP